MNPLWCAPGGDILEALSLISVLALTSSEWPRACSVLSRCWLGEAEACGGELCPLVVRQKCLRLVVCHLSGLCSTSSLPEGRPDCTSTWTPDTVNWDRCTANLLDLSSVFSFPIPVKWDAYFLSRANAPDICSLTPGYSTTRCTVASEVCFSCEYKNYELLLGGEHEFREKGSLCPRKYSFIFGAIRFESQVAFLLSSCLIFL